MKVLHPIILLIVLFINALSAAAAASPSASIISAPSISKPAMPTEGVRLWRQILSVYNGMKSATPLNHDKIHVNQLLTKECGMEHPDNQLAKALKAEARQQHSNYGLSFRGGYTSDDIRDETGNPDAYVELSWDLWRKGYAENKRRAASLEQQADLTQLRAQLAQQKLNNQCRRYRINQAFTGLIAHLLSLKLALMEPVYRIEKRAYFKSWSYLDDLLVSEQDIRLLREELKYLNSSPYLDSALNKVINLPVIDINIQAIIQAIRDDGRFVKLKQIEKEALSKKINVRDDDRLRLFVRKQFSVGNNNDSGIVAGFRFTIPLEKRRKLAEEYRLAHIDQQSSLQTWEKITRTRAAYQSLREQLQRTIKQQYRFLRSNERMRRTLVQTKLNHEIQLASAATRMRTLLDANIELVRAKEELYRRVNEVFLIASIQFNSSFIKLTPLQEDNYRARPGERSIYLWSKGFNQFSNETILDFLKAKNIQRVLLTASRAVQKEKMLRFIERARQEKIKIESIVGPNTLFFKQNHDAATIAVEAASTLSDAIHLDVEPHTFSGYKLNKESYLKQYIGMLRAIRKNSPDITLTVAVPFHWPENIYAALDSLVDRVYIMTYGSNQPETIIRRLQPAIKNISANKIIPVLRVTDFEDEWQIEKMINALQQGTGLQNFSLHTFRYFMQKVAKK